MNSVLGPEAVAARLLAAAQVGLDRLISKVSKVRKVMSKAGDRAAGARDKAEAMWSRAKEAATKERDEAAVAEQAKTARLRALRLAKEAADRVVAEEEAARKAALKAATKGKRKTAAKQ